MSDFDTAKLERVREAAAKLKSCSATDIARYLSTPEAPVSKRSLERICKHPDVVSAATGALDGERKGIKRATAKLAERKILAAASEEEKASEARDKAIEAALKWLKTPEGERKYDDAGRMPDLVRFGLELARDRGKSRDAGRLLSEKARIDREAKAAPDGTTPQPGDTIIVEAVGFEPRILPKLTTAEEGAA